MDHKNIDKIYLTTKKILREFEQNDNTLLNEKVINFVLENTCVNLLEEIVFEGEKNSIFDIGLRAITNDSICKLKVYLNNVLVINYEFSGEINISKKLYLNKSNSLKFEVLLDDFSDVKLVVNLFGKIKVYKNKLINAKNIGQDLYLSSNGYLSKSNDILSCTQYINNKLCYNNDKYFDHNVNSINNKYFICGVLSNNGGAIVINESGDDLFALNFDNVMDACIIGSESQNYCYNIVLISDGKLYYASYNSNFLLVNEVQLTALKNILFKEVKSISSDSFVSSFWAKSQSDFWYLIDIDLSTGDVLKVREFKNCVDIQSYFYDNKHIVIEQHENGVDVEKFNTINLMNRVSSYTYTNVDNAFFYDGDIYLINADNIQNVEV